MPNWTHNRLEVEGGLDDLVAFMAAVRGDKPGEDASVLDFERHLPTPVNLLRRDPFTEYSWREWRLEHWGTKWNASDAELEGRPQDGAVTYSFNTAWRPPDQWLGFVSEAHPLWFTLEYVEELAHFAGRGVWIAGSLVEHEELDPLGRSGHAPRGSSPRSRPFVRP